MRGNISDKTEARQRDANGRRSKKKITRAGSPEKYHAEKCRRDHLRNSAGHIELIAIYQM